MLKNCIKNWKRIDDDMAADVAQCERSKIKCYASAFSNILIYSGVYLKGFEHKNNLFPRKTRKRKNEIYELMCTTYSTHLVTAQLCICLETVYLVETENILLKLL